jgi:uncharacterized protein YjbJ (UPF0337 family)
MASKTGKNGGMAACGTWVARLIFARGDGLRNRVMLPSQGDGMSNLTNRGAGAAGELLGKIKGTVGKVIGNPQMEAEGRAKELQGKNKQAAAKAAERVGGKADEIVGVVKKRVGALIDNEQMEVEGKAKELKGKARQRANQ